MIYATTDAPSALLNYLFLQVANSAQKSLLGGHCKISKTEVCTTEVWPDPMLISCELFCFLIKNSSVHSGFVLQSGFLSKSDSSRDGSPKSPIIMCSRMYGRMQVLLTSDFGRNPDCNAEP